MYILFFYLLFPSQRRLGDFLFMIFSEQSVVTKFYKNNTIWHDKDRRDRIIRYAMMLEKLPFNIAIDSPELECAE